MGSVVGLIGGALLTAAGSLRALRHQAQAHAQ
jgi:hypothetical protein